MEGQDEQETESSISYTEKNESPIVCLSNLMIDIHEAAKTLTDSPGAYPNHSTGLDSYPVGIVLQLAQDLFRILNDNSCDLRNFPTITKLQKGSGMNV